VGIGGGAAPVPQQQSGQLQRGMLSAAAIGRGRWQALLMRCGGGVSPTQLPL